MLAKRSRRREQVLSVQECRKLMRWVEENDPGLLVYPVLCLFAGLRPEREAPEIERVLQARGVPVHEALQTPALFEDPQLQLRGHFVEIGHDIFPTTTVESSRLVLSRSAPRVPERALSMGRDNRLVLETILGYSAERIDTLLDSEVMR